MASSGDIIGIINADDWYVKNAVSEIVNLFNEKTDVIYANINLVYNDGNIDYGFSVSINDIWHSMIPHLAVFIKRKIYKKYGVFDLHYKYSADYDLMLRLYVNGVFFQFLDKSIAYFRKGGLSTVKKLDCVEEAKNISMKYIDRCSEKEKYLPIINEKYLDRMIDAKLESDNGFLKKRLLYLFGDLKKSICIFGAGYWGKILVYKMIDCGIKCNYIIDNDIYKQGTFIENIEVKSVKILKHGLWNVIISCRDTALEVKKQLLCLNNPDINMISLIELCDL
jgi:hypothetical protein